MRVLETMVNSGRKCMSWQIGMEVSQCRTCQEHRLCVCERRWSSVCLTWHMMMLNETHYFTDIQNLFLRMIIIYPDHLLICMFIIWATFTSFLSKLVASMAERKVRSSDNTTAYVAWGSHHGMSIPHCFGKLTNLIFGGA